MTKPKKPYEESAQFKLWAMTMTAAAIPFYAAHKTKEFVVEHQKGVAVAGCVVAAAAVVAPLVHLNNLEHSFPNK